MPTIAYLSDAKLFFKTPDAPAAKLVQSTFAQEMIDRANRDRQRNEWKSSSAGWMSSSRGPLLLAGMNAQQEDARKILITGLSRGCAPHELLYALETESVGGLFVYDANAGEERRLFHRQQFRARDLARHPSEDLIALSNRYDDGTANIALMPPNGKGLRDVTEGDSVDEAPAWVPGAARTIVFQSAGIGRNQAGHTIALGPYAIQRLDLERDEFTTLLEDEHTDFLIPRLAADGTLYFIQRPWQPHGHESPSPLKFAMDALLFPVRLASAIVGFLNFFSVMFSNQPLITAGGPKREGPSTRYLQFWGKWIDAEKQLKKAERKGPEASLVPDSWKLIRRRPNGDEDVLASGAVCFDLAPDGSLVYTNGRAVYHLDAAGNRTTLCTDKMIERLIVAG
ncbi:MAG TPA: hypothetical protein VH475_07915 [Tepidisphaeraceae bacterium]|jgi:hypothetical protein